MSTRLQKIQLPNSNKHFLLRDSKVFNLEFILKVQIFRNKIQELRQIKEYQSAETKYLPKLLSYKCSWGRSLLVFEYIDGVSLEQIMQNYFIPEEYKKFIIKSLCLSVNSLQKEGLFHGDLSPANIMFDKNARLKLIDAYLFESSDPKYATRNYSDKLDHKSNASKSILGDIHAIQQIAKTLDLNFENNEYRFILDTQAIEYELEVPEAFVEFLSSIYIDKKKYLKPRSWRLIIHYAFSSLLFVWVFLFL